MSFIIHLQETLQSAVYANGKHLNKNLASGSIVSLMQLLFPQISRALQSKPTATKSTYAMFFYAAALLPSVVLWNMIWCTGLNRFRGFQELQAYIFQNNKNMNAVRLVSSYQLNAHFLYSVTIYGVSQEECARLQEGVPYVKVYRYNPKHLCPNLNGYGDNGQRSLKFWQLLHTYWLSNTY